METVVTTSDVSTEPAITTEVNGEVVAPPVETPEVVEAEKPAEPVEPDDDEAEDPPATDEKPKKKGGYQRTIEKLSERLAEAERKLAEGAPAPVKAPEAPTPLVEPKAEDFDDYEAYIDARADYRTELKWQEKQASEAKAREDAEAQAHHRKVQESWAQRVEAAVSKHEDFQDVLSESTAPMTDIMHETILESDLGPELAYWLAKNPADAARIANLAPLAQARELGRVEASFAQQPGPVAVPAKKTSQAPAPITPVGKSPSASQKSPDEMSFREFDEWRDAQIAARR